MVVSRTVDMVEVLAVIVLGVGGVIQGARWDGLFFGEMFWFNFWWSRFFFKGGQKSIKIQDRKLKMSFLWRQSNIFGENLASKKEFFTTV